MTENFLSELSNPTRIEILNLLQRNPMKQSQIAQKLDVTIQGISRHIDRLTDSSLIEKTADGVMTITPLGQASLIQARTFEFLFKHKKYFSEHAFAGVPEHLIRRIGELESSEYVENPMDAWQKAKEMAHSTKEYFFGTAPTAPLEIIPLFAEFANTGIKTRIIFAKNSIVPKGFNKEKQKQWSKYLKEGTIEEMYVQHMPFVVCVNEKVSHVQFQNKRLGEIDAKSFFISNDQKFRKWCRDLFDYCWNNEKRLEPFVLEEK